LRLALLCSLFVIAAVGSLAQNGDAHPIVIPMDDTSFRPDPNRVVTMSLGGVNATFKGTSPVTLDVKHDDFRKTIVLPSDLAQVNAARLFGKDTMVISGFIDGNASTVVTVDLSNGAVLDSFLCYSPAISPDGRYVAFIKFFPEHGVSSAEDHYVIYDVAAGPSRNRQSVGKSDRASVGRVLFPKGSGNNAGDNVDVGNGPTHSMASDQFFWNEQSTEVVFVDLKDSQYTAVVARPSQRPECVLSTDIPTTAICPRGASPCYERLTRVSFSDSPTRTIHLAFRGVNGTPARESQLLLSESGPETLSISPVP